MQNIMKKMEVRIMLVFVSLCVTIFSGSSAEALSYDYSASNECLTEPLKPQYGGGIIQNPELDDGLKGWTTFGFAEITEKTSETGNRFFVARSRFHPYQSLSQKAYLEKEKLYTFSAWVQLNEGNAVVSVIFKTAGGFTHAGAVDAKFGCWSMLKGGLTVETSGPAEFYFESENTTVGIWVDSVSLQPFTKDQWRSHQTESTEKARTRKVRFHAVDTHGNILPNATVSIQQTRPGFLLGASITQSIIDNDAYRKWFASRFTVTSSQNEMKWYSNEPSPGNESYWAADRIVAFAKEHGIAVRGHNIFWADVKYQPYWVPALSKKKLWYAANRRVNSVVSRYKGQFIAWDVMNENVHYSFFEGRLKTNASTIFFRKAHEIDRNTLMFMNEFNTLEEPSDKVAIPSKYLKKLNKIRLSGAPLAIGLQGHFRQPNIPYMRSALDMLAGAKLPIWLTEVDVDGPDQAKNLEEVLREAYSHPAVKGIIIWAGWKPKACLKTCFTEGPHPPGCSKMCLTDENFVNFPTGDLVDKLISEWRTGNVVGVTDSDGFFETQLFHGEYEVKISHPFLNSSSVQSLKLDEESQHNTALLVEIQA